MMAVNRALPPEARALLDTIAGTESPGYNVIYGGRTFNNYSDHPGVSVPIKSGVNAGKKSSAAGRYQFLESTWDSLNLPNFSPPMQDFGAWKLAQRDYKTKTGNDLMHDLRSGDIGKIGKVLSSTWTSLPGGIEAGTNRSKFGNAYQHNLGQYADSGKIMTDAPQSPTLLEKWNARQKAVPHTMQPTSQLQGGKEQKSPTLLEKWNARKQAAPAQQPIQPKGDIGSMTAKQLVAAYPSITGDVPPIPGSKEEQARARYFELSKAPEPTIAQKVVGMGEAGLSLLSGMTTGTAGEFAGSIKGIADTIIGGKYGTNQGADDAEKTAVDWASALTYAPRTTAGQKYAGAVSEAIAPLQAVAPLAPMQTLGAMSRGAALPRTAARTAEKSAVSTAAADVANAKRYGIPVMTSDINVPDTWGGRMSQAITERIPVVGTGGQRAAQQSGRVGAVQDFLRNYGAENTTPAINDVTASLLQKRRSDLARYSAMKNEAINRNPGGVVPMQATNEAIDAQIAKLQGMNTQAVKPLISKLEDYKTAFANQDMPTVELLRKQLGDELQSPDMATVKTAAGQAASSVYGGLKRDMGDYIKATGDRRDFDKWQVANSRLSEMIGEVGNTGLKAALKKGEATPETIRSLLFSKKPSDLELLRKNLTPEGRNSAKTAIMQEAYAKIGTETSPERFVTQMDKLATQTGAMLTTAEKAELKGLVDALQLTKRAGVANVKPVTGAELTGFATPAAATYMAGGNPIAGLTVTAVGGLFAQAYESPVMRNMMIALGKTTDRVQKQRIYDSMLFMANNSELTAAAAGQTGGLLSVPASQGLLDQR